MHKLRFTLGALALLLSTQSHAAGDAGSCHYVPVAKIPVDFSDRAFQATVTGSVNGTPVRMLVDTGAHESKLMRASAERLGLTLAASGSYSYGVGGASVTYIAHIDDFALGDAHTGKTLMPVIGNAALRAPHDAIVGASFLLQTDMELSLKDKYMQFFRASGCSDTYLAYWDPNAMEIPFEGRLEGSNQPLVTVELNGVKLHALIDSGASRTVVKRHAAELAGVKIDGPKVRKEGKIAGIGDEVLDSWTADFKRFSIGDETVNNPRLTIMDDSPQGQDRIDILLGIDFLRAHHVLFAMSQDRLYLSYLGGELFGATQQAPAAPPKAP
jgi:predicted aspartyl protease